MKIELVGTTPVKVETTTQQVFDALHRRVRAYCGVPADAIIHEGYWAEGRPKPFLPKKIRHITEEEKNVLAALERLQEYLP